MDIENRKLYDLFRAVKTDGMNALGLVFARLCKHS